MRKLTTQERSFMYVCKSDPVPLLLKGTLQWFQETLLWFLVVPGRKFPVFIIQNIHHSWFMPLSPHIGLYRDCTSFQLFKGHVLISVCCCCC